ncbi:transposase [Microcoleus sp. AT3-A2]
MARTTQLVTQSTNHNLNHPTKSVLLSDIPKVQMSKLVNNLKTVSSRLIRKEFSAQVNKFYYKPVFWTGAYFVSSCGSVTFEKR